MGERVSDVRWEGMTERDKLWDCTGDHFKCMFFQGADRLTVDYSKIAIHPLVHHLIRLHHHLMIREFECGIPMTMEMMEFFDRLFKSTDSDAVKLYQEGMQYIDLRANEIQRVCGWDNWLLPSIIDYSVSWHPYNCAILSPFAQLFKWIIWCQFIFFHSSSHSRAISPHALIFLVSSCMINIFLALRKLEFKFKRLIPIPISHR